MLLSHIKKYSDRIFSKYSIKLHHYGLTANRTTLISFLFTLVSLYFFFKSQLILGGISLILVYFFDFLDGNIARATKTQTNFGFFLDKTADLFRIVCWIPLALNNHLTFELALLVIFSNALGFHIGVFSEKLNLKTIKGVPSWTDWFIVLAVLSNYIVFFATAMVVINSLLIIINILSVIWLNRKK